MKQALSLWQQRKWFLQARAESQPKPKEIRVKSYELTWEKIKYYLYLVSH